MLRLAAAAHRDPSTVVRVLQGRGNRLSREAVDAAAKTLGIPVPTDEGYSMRQSLSVRSVDVLPLAAEIHRDPRTVVSAIDGKGSRNSRSAVEDAAKKLGIELPVAATERT